MITYYYKSPKAKATEVLQDYKSGAWVNVEKPTKHDIEYLVDTFGLNRGHINDALDPDEMPRLERENNIAYVFVRYAYTNEELELTTAPLLLIVGPDVFVTVGLRPMPRLQRFLDGKIDFSTAKRTKLLLAVMDQIVDQYEVFINNISHQIKIIRARLRNHDVGNKDFIDFVLIEDELNEFLSALTPATAILRRIMLGRHIPLEPDDQELVEDLSLNTEQSIEGCRSNVKSIVNIRQAYATIASNNLNRTMKLLTAATVMIALPTMFFSLYGMNVQLPLMDSPFAFLLIVMLSLFATIAIAIIARIKRIF